MKVLELADVKRWLGEKGWTVGDDSMEAPGVVDAPVYELPPTPGGRLSVARALARLLEGEPEALIWIHEYGIWPNSEHRPLFDRLRFSWGEGRPLREAPGHLVAGTEQADVVSLLALVMYFSWGAFVVAPSSKFAAVISHHDSLGLLLGGTPEQNSAAQVSLDMILESGESSASS